jgi:hypothetical protein
MNDNDLFTFPEIPSSQSVALMRSSRPETDPSSSVTKLAERFGVKGNVQDAGSRLIVRDDASSLEFFVATSSVRWNMWPAQSSEAQAAPRLLDEREAIDRATSWLRELGLEHEAASVTSVTDLELSFRRAGERQETTWALARQVNLGFQASGLPFFGPGAKMQVSLGDAGRPIETLRFWRDVEPTGEAATISPEEVIDILRRDETFAQLRPGESTVRFETCRLGYYALPPREVQRLLVPVFAISGTATTPALDRYEFMRYVPAVPLPEKSRGRQPSELRAAASF